MRICAAGARQGGANSKCRRCRSPIRSAPTPPRAVASLPLSGVLICLEVLAPFERFPVNRISQRQRHGRSWEQGRRRECADAGVSGGGRCILCAERRGGPGVEAGAPPPRSLRVTWAGSRRRGSRRRGSGTEAGMVWRRQFAHACAHALPSNSTRAHTHAHLHAHTHGVCTPRVRTPPTRTHTRMRIASWARSREARGDCHTLFSRSLAHKHLLPLGFRV